MTRRERSRGFMLVEALAVAAIFFAVIASGLGVYFASLGHARNVAEESVCETLAQSIESAIRAGAASNLRTDRTSFHFVFEGVAVSVNLPQAPGSVSTYPAGEPWLYPVGTLVRLPEGVITAGGGFLGTSFGRAEQIETPVFENGDDLDRDGVLLVDEDCGSDGLSDPYEPGAKGPDGAWGVAGVDDDGNGIVDDVFEYLAPGSDDVFDPNHDDFDPTRNPFGSEGDGMREAGEPDLNGNGLLDSPPRCRAPYLGDAGALGAHARFDAMARCEPSRDFGYRLRVKRSGPIGRGDMPSGGGPSFRMTIEMYPDFAEARRRFRAGEPVQRLRDWQFLIRFN
ncbi:MAG: type II secretion system protein [Planctomycetes bacterium]|nr:type II secretion system protein [Planctomycetota bacterium]